MSRRNQAFIVAVVLSAIWVAGLSGCGKEQQPTPPAPEVVSNVSVIVTQRTTVPDWLEAIGTVHAAQASQLASQMMGNIVELRAHEGDLVQRGQILATLDDTQPRAAVEQASAAVTAAEEDASAADANFTLAEATLKRYQQLYDRKSASPQEFDEVKARRQAAEARRDMARARLAQAQAALTQARVSHSYAQIRAPFAGIITERKVDTGTLAAPGTTLFTVEDTRRYRLEATVDESGVQNVRIGQLVSVLIDALGDSARSARVVQIIPAVDPASRSFLVKIDLPADPRLRSGLFARARFPRGERAALLIPQSAVVERGQLQGVYVLDANRTAELRYVTLGKVADQRVEVLSGLEAGEKLVAAPGGRELSGKQIAASP